MKTTCELSKSYRSRRKRISKTNGTPSRSRSHSGGSTKRITSSGVTMHSCCRAAYIRTNATEDEDGKQWRQVWESYEIVSLLKEQNNEYRIATFVTCIGSEALEISSALPFETEDDKKSMSKVIELMEYVIV